METKITNIFLEGENIVVDAIFNGNNERQVFNPESNIQDISDWVTSRKEYYLSLTKKVEDIKKAFLNKEL